MIWRRAAPRRAALSVVASSYRSAQKNGDRMSSVEPSLKLPDGVRLERLPPKSRRIRNHLPEWDVRLRSTCVGRIEQWTVRSSSSVFYRATAYHPDTGKSIPLESSTDLGERVAKILAAWHDPERFIHRSSWDQPVPPDR